MIFNILDNTTELWMTKYIIGEIFSFGGATLYKNPSDQTVIGDKAMKRVKHQLVKNIDKMLETGQRPEQLALQGSPQGCLEEARIYELIDTILINVGADHSSSGSSGLVKSLKSINLAQKLSLKQECRHKDGMLAGYRELSKRNKKDIFDITVIKGAASVLVNAYMKNPNLTQEKANLASAFGYLGQFINDIEGHSGPENLKKSRQKNS